MPASFLIGERKKGRMWILVGRWVDEEDMEGVGEGKLYSEHII